MTSFAPIPGCPVGYVADSQGNIYGPKGPLKPKPMGSKLGADQKRPYSKFAVWDTETKRPKDKSWHRSVYSAFYGCVPPGLVVRHLDGDPTNNDISNLGVGTQSENLKDRLRHGTMTRGEVNGMSRLTEADVRYIREVYSSGNVTQQELGARFGVDRRHIGAIVVRKVWRHVS